MPTSSRAIPTPSRWPAPRGRVAFEDVSFSYRKDTPLITDLSLVAEPGPDHRHRRAHRRRQDHAGQPDHAVLRARRRPITIDGGDIATMKRSDLRRNIGMVLQDTWLSAARSAPTSPTGTRRPARSRSPRRPSHLRRPVRALAARRLRHAPRRRGRTTLSAGEKQLLTIARPSWPTRPSSSSTRATSSVDTRTEVLIQQAMAALRSSARRSSSPTGSRPSATRT